MTRRAVVVALLLGCTSPPGDDSPAHPPGESGGEDTGPPLSQAVGLLSINLHCLQLDGTDFSSNQERLQLLARAVQAEQVSVLALQELCVSAEQSAPDLLLAALQEETGQEWSLATAYAHLGWEGTEDEAEEYVGLAVRGPLSEPRGVPVQA